MYGLWLSWRELYGCGCTGGTFWPNGRNDGKNFLAQNKASWTFYTSHFVCRPHRSRISRLLDSKSCEREGNNSFVDVNCEEEWWCHSMFHDSVPREITGLDQWKCLVGGGRDKQWSVGLIWENDDVLAPWSMALSPAGESGTIDGFWHPGSCSNFELCAMAKQLSVLQTASLPWAHPSLSSRPSSISQRWMKKFTQALHVFSITLFILSIPGLVYVFCCLPSELWCRRPLAPPSPQMIYRTWTRRSPQRTWQMGDLGSNQRMTECALACPGIGRGSLQH